MLKILCFIDAVLGIWLAGTWAYLFWWLKQGASVQEPNTVIASIEFYVACGLSVWFMGQVVYLLLVMGGGRGQAEG